jgi:16S rRNA processing protein RimM
VAAEGASVELGRVSGVFGVRGWVKVYSYARPRENILAYSPWRLELPDGTLRTCRVRAGRVHGKGLVALLDGVDDADAAQALVGADIRVDRAQFGEAGPGSWYWADLEGLRVLTLAGEELGRVEALMETGANDVLVVQGDRRRLIPFVNGQIVREVDLPAGTLTVDWDPDF